MAARPLADRLSEALTSGAPALENLRTADPVDRADRFATLLAIYDLSLAPLDRVGTTACFERHPAVAELKWRLESEWLAELESDDAAETDDLPDDAVAALRALAARDRLPAVYHWVAKEAGWPELVAFLAVEGGPDGGFDDLVALCQVGLDGRPKLELARNYWDEMGNGDLAGVHTTLHADLSRVLDVPHLPPDLVPAAALQRTALGGLLATNHWLQPEMLGAMGLIELQAGPRSRLVLAGLERLGADEAALPFYRVHAEVDPHHGAGWLAEAIGPLLEEHPSWAGRVVRGARWRSRVNAEFFDIARRTAEQLARRTPAAA